MSQGSVDMAVESDGGFLDCNVTNVTNSSPHHYQEDDARWCYVEGHVEVCVR